jgi:hypothetical protein
MQIKKKITIMYICIREQSLSVHKPRCPAVCIKAAIIVDGANHSG